MHLAFLVFMFILGACFGSYLCCQVRRLYLRSSVPSGKSSTKTSRAHSSRSATRTGINSRTKSQRNLSLGKRSVCLSCGYQLKWYDNIPIVSWLLLRGKCRHCHTKIGILEILSELSLAVAFLLLGFTIDPFTATALDWLIFAVGALLFLILGFLAIYDGAYGQLPSLCLTFSIICATLLLILKQWVLFSSFGFSWQLVLDPLGAVAILGGVYLLLYLISHGKWVGDGDWILGVALGLALGHSWLALVTLFLANVLACLVMLPHVVRSHSSKIYFGPFMVAAFIAVFVFSDFFLSLISANFFG